MESSAAGPPTFDAALSQWMTARCLTAKPKTVAFYREWRAAIDAEWPAPALDISLAQMKADWILSFASRLTHFCPSRWNRVVWAVRAIRPQLGTLLATRGVSRRDFTPPTQQQFAALLAECDASRRSRAGLVVRFLALTGLRISEARGLRWEHVHADHLEVPAELAKGGHRRSVPLLPGLQDVLIRLKGLDSGGFVLPRSNPRKAIERITRRLFGRPWSFHCFRHLFTTRCVEALVDLPTLARWLGHQDGGALLARTYFHLLDEHSRNMVARVRM